MCVFNTVWALDPLQDVDVISHLTYDACTEYVCVCLSVRVYVLGSSVCVCVCVRTRYSRMLQFVIFI